MSTAPANDSNFDYYGMTKSEVITLTVFSSCISSVGTVSNILVILAVVMTRQLRENCTAVLLISLSVCDAIICAGYVTMYIYDINHGSSTVFFDVRRALGIGFLAASLTGELNVTLERFIYICYPYHYINWMNMYIVVAAFLAQWLFALAVIAPLLVTSKPCRYTGVYLVVVIAIIVGLHLKIHCVSRRESRKIARQYPAQSKNKRMQIWNKSATTVAMAIMTSLLCWAPMLILPVVVSPTSPSFVRYIKIMAAFTSLSSAIRPFIICWKLSHFRNALVTCLRRLYEAFQSG